jgi:inner membrane protein
MLGHTHVVIAAALWAGVWWRPLAVGDHVLSAPVAPLGTDLPPALGSLAVVALGALLPDLDHPGALLARLRPAGTRGPWRHFRPLLFPSVALREGLGHRGALHSLLGLAVATALAEYLGTLGGGAGLGWTLGWGYAAHLLADMATRRGVPLLWPLARLRVGVPRAIAIKTGSFGEALYLAGVSALAALHASGALLV